MTTKVTTGVIADDAVTSAKLASGAAVDNIGYTPVNKAGDTLTGALTVGGLIESTSGGFKFPDGTTQTTVAAGIPPGTMAAFTDDPGSGWLACDGSIYAKSAYPELGAVLDKYPVQPALPSDVTPLSTSINSYAELIVNGYAFSGQDGVGYNRIDLSTGTVTTGNLTSINRFWSPYHAYNKDFMSYNGSIYCAIANNDQTMYSSNGATWTYSSTYTGLQPEFLTWDGTYFLGVRNNTFSALPCRRSTNGATWSSAGNLPNHFYRSIASDGAGTTVVAGISSAVGNSGGNVQRPAFGSGYSKIAYTTNSGTSWTEATLPTGSDYSFYDVSYVNSQFIAVSGYQGLFLTSNDGINWTLIQSNYRSYNTYASSWKIDYYDGWYYIEHCKYRSKDLKTWYLIEGPLLTQTQNIRSCIDPATGVVFTGYTYPSDTPPYFVSVYDLTPYNTSTHFAVPMFFTKNSTLLASTQTFFIKT